MITLAATAVSDVVVAIGSTATSPSIATESSATVATTTASDSMSAVSTLESKISAGATNVASGLTAAFTTPIATTLRSGTTTMMTTRPATTRRRHKVKEFNDLISCFLCSGYLMIPTTVDYCGHSYCRTCIIKHCKVSKYCPKCGTHGKQISLSNLRVDELLKSLIYKMVPGLYHNEYQRQIQFAGNDGGSGGEIDETVIADDEEDYFSPVEPISLSLEYHPDSLKNCSKDQMPPVRYLQCPAAVTVHHLQRLISSKFNIDLENSRVTIEIIYEDEILPEDFSLMDVGYCYLWKRDNPMRFFYRILVHSTCNNPEKVTISDSIISKSEDKTVVEAKCTIKPNKTNDKSNRGNKVVHFKDDLKQRDIGQPEKFTTMAVRVKREKIEKPKTKEYDDDEDDDDVIFSDSNHRSNMKTTYTILKTKNVKNEDSQSYNNNNNNSPTSKYKKNGQEAPKESVKMTIIARKTSTTNEPKIKTGKGKRSPKTPPVDPIAPVSDFKSLRSNDLRYMTDFSANLTPTGKQHKSKTSPPKSAPPKCGIFVSIPQQGHRNSNSSDDSTENLSLAQLKTANKKSSSTAAATLRQSISLDESLLSRSAKPATKMDVPKLKITVPKKLPTASKIRKPSVEEPANDKVDLTTYAKHIGLKPINPPVEEKRELKLKLSPNASPASSSVSSSSASSPPSAVDTHFPFSSSDVSTTSTHKKRKKAKHSKEPKEPGSKRKKLHAEIASLPADESLKLKVKLNYKAERKASTSSDEVIITSPEVTPTSKSETTIVRPMVNIPIHKPSVETARNLNNVAKTAPGTIASSSNLKTTLAPTIKVPLPKPISALKSVPIQGSGTTAVSNSTTPPAKLILPKVQNLQGTKLPASPPLPPSLFKTVPMALPSSKPIEAVPRTTIATTLQPKSTLPPARPSNNFAVPNPPPRLQPASPKLSPISTIASAANRQAQLKRSASLDGCPPAKQPKIEPSPDRTAKKVYSPFHASKMISSPAAAATIPIGNGLKIAPKPAFNPASSPKPIEQTYYTSTMATAYTRENQTKKPTPISLPPSSISVTKMPDVASGTMAQSPTSGGLTIIPQQQHQSQHQQRPTQSASPLHQQQSSKPALEIVRISSIIPPIDQQKLPITNNNTVKPNPPKTTRPLPPTIPLVKIKRSANQLSPQKSTVTTVMSPIQQQAVLSIGTNVKPAESTTPTTTNGLSPKKNDPKPIDVDEEPPKSASPKTATSICDTTGVLDLSGKSSRSPSQDKTSPPQTPTAGSPNNQSSENIVEAALRKLAQKSTPTSPTTTASALISSSPTLTTSIAISNSTTTTTLKLTPATTAVSPIASPLQLASSTGLQNLKMLSESATNREKITIKSPRQLPVLPKLNEITKIRQTPTVRQQNASVRNIPNPSALAFRSQQPMPMLASITNTSVAATTKSSTTTTVAAPKPITPTVASELKPLENETKVQKPTAATSPVASTTLTVTSSTTKSSSNSSTTAAVSTTVTSSSDASKLLLASKKNLHLEQLAASLNMRAAAAANGSIDSLTKVTTNSSTTLSPTRTVSTTAALVSSSSSTTVSSSSSSSATSLVSATSSAAATTNSTAASPTVSVNSHASLVTTTVNTTALVTTSSTPVISPTST